MYQGNLLRVQQTALQTIELKHYYQGKLFNGIIYQLKNDWVLPFKCEKGKVSGPYINEQLPPELKDSLKIYWEALSYSHSYEYCAMEDAEPCFYNGTPFSGLAYEFDKAFCVAERWYQAGHTQEAYYWYRTGVPEVLDIFTNPVMQAATWYENGNLKTSYLVETKNSELSLKFNEHQQLHAMTMGGDYFDRIAQLSPYIKIPIILTKESDANDFQGAPYLLLSGAGITDSFFEQLQANDGLFVVESLCFYQTALTGKSILALVSESTIKKISLKGALSQNGGLIENFKTQRPDCSVELLT